MNTENTKPLISMICFNDTPYLKEFLASQTNINLEYVTIEPTDSFKDIIDYICNASSEYICFFEAKHIYDTNKIQIMSDYLHTHPDIQIAISPRQYIDENRQVISKSGMLDCSYLGQTILEYSIQENHNIYGDLSTIMVSTSYAQQIPWHVPDNQFDAINRIALLYQLLLYGNAYFLDRPFVSVVLQECNSDSETQHLKLENDFMHYTEFLFNQNLLTRKWNPPVIHTHESVDFKKEMTFFYTDKGEFYNLKPIADRAAERGYTTKFSTTVNEPAEIGVYCQHTGMLIDKDAKFSVILFHDMAQGHNRWPDMWDGEPWDIFDIGILPGKNWANRWVQCAHSSYARPTYGAFALGYPKADTIFSPAIKERAEELRKQFRFKYNYSVLYAPSWENDEKEDDFIRALCSLPINLLIKQASWSDDFSHIIQNIADMRNLHEGKYENVYYIEPEESILTALELCDMVVSDESSVMAEALMFGKISLAVTDWLIPDTTPARFASCPMEYILKCKKVELREYVERISSGTFPKDTINDVLQKGIDEYTNKGHCCDDILDAIEYYTGLSDTPSDFMTKKLNPAYELRTLWN